MVRVAMVWGRGLVFGLVFACVSACNQDGAYSGSSVSPLEPPAAGNPHPRQPGNSAPQIAGNPGAEVRVGNLYRFVPSATDADGDALTFSIASKPDWAVFDTASGRLSGTPQPGDAGSYEEITIRVSDARSTRALPQFSINVAEQSNGSVTLAWQPPTENTDGSPLMNLNGYRIHYGTEPGNYANTISVHNAGVTRYVIENLAPGTYFFAITAISGVGAESDPSREATKTI
jgi:hypothetical protein